MRLFSSSNPMDSAFSVTTTAQMVLFRAFHRHFAGAPHRSLLRCKLKCVVASSYNNRFRIQCSSASFPSAPLSTPLHTFPALLSRTRCRTRCISSSAASFASSAGGGNDGAGAGYGGGGGGGSGGESGDANLKLVGDTAKELSALSPDVIILDVSV